MNQMLARRKEKEECLSGAYTWERLGLETWLCLDVKSVVPDKGRDDTGEVPVTDLVTQRRKDAPLMKKQQKSYLNYF